MPKQKTHKGAAKRFNLTKDGKVKHAQAFKRHILTKNGKVKRAQAYKRHILTKKPTKRTRNLRKAAYVYSGEAKTMKKLIPYK